MRAWQTGGVHVQIVARDGIRANLTASKCSTMIVFVFSLRTLVRSNSPANSDKFILDSDFS